jgi:hypothetical protein
MNIKVTVRAAVMALVVASSVLRAGVSSQAIAVNRHPGAACEPWTVAKAPGPSYAVALNGVSGTSSTDVWAVGSPYFVTLPLILHWDGSAWTEVPPQPRVDATLYAVEAITPSDAWAVGVLGELSVAEHWDGQTWRRVTTPRPGTIQYAIDVAAISSSDVWSVGFFSDQERGGGPFTMHWGGQSWSFVHAPNGTLGTNVFLAVSAASADDVWAVGSQEESSNYQPLIEHWDGSAWTVVPAAPPPTGTTNFLYGVEAISANDVWAVGSYGARPTVPLLEHWDGSAWSRLEAPFLTGSLNVLYAVSAASPYDVWAVGEHDPGPFPGDYRTLTLHWDGTAWNEIRAKSPGVNADFSDVVAISSDDVWAVGAFYDSGPLHPLTERSNGCSS